MMHITWQYILKTIKLIAMIVPANLQDDIFEWTTPLSLKLVLHLLMIVL